MNLGDLFVPYDLEEVKGRIEYYVQHGWVRRQFHDTAPLAILNYTEKTTFDKRWDDITLTCRGLIYNTETFEVVARPFPKFFNHNEEAAPKFDLDEVVYVTDKMDGSLGILYSYEKVKWNGGAMTPIRYWEIATRGSFHSPQALEASDMLFDLYPEFDPPLGYTMLFEIIYPTNRIVLDYGDRRELVLLGGVDMVSGEIDTPNAARRRTGWTGPIAASLGRCTFRQALEAPPRPNSEGIVVIAENDDRMVKIKQEDYIHLHRIITGLNARSVWQHMGDNDYTTDGLKENLPEEFWPWVDEVADILITHEADLWNAIEDDYFKRVVVGGDRGQQARAFADSEYKPYLFAYLDEDYDRVHRAIWKKLRPEADWSPYNGGRDEVAESGTK